MRISIALATCNGEKYIKQQLDSLQAQTVQPDELVVCDDNSSDATVEIVKEFARYSSFEVSVHVNETALGYTQNFARALEKTSGALVFLCDQDDVWIQEKIEKVVAAFQADPSRLLLIHDLDFCQEDLRPIGQTKIERMQTICDLDHKYVVGMATAIRRPLLDICLPIPDVPGLSHDRWLHDCARSIGCKGILNEVLAKYRRHADNVTNEELLNVAYVTTPSDLLAGAVTKSTNLQCAEQRALLSWLTQNKKVLVEKGLLTLEQLDLVFNKEEQKSAVLEARAAILTLPRLTRLPRVVAFFFSGGYKNFSGWRSAAKDILFN